MKAQEMIKTAGGALVVTTPLKTSPKPSFAEMVKNRYNRMGKVPRRIIQYGGAADVGYRIGRMSKDEDE